MRLSDIIPAYNGVGTVSTLVKRVKHGIPSRYELEIVLVNDGSPSDNSAGGL